MQILPRLFQRQPNSSSTPVAAFPSRWGGFSLLSACLMGLAYAAAFAGESNEAGKTEKPPEWRDSHPEAAYLGPDVLWRPREWMIFHLLDEKGGGFELEVDVRDMNTYLQGPRRFMVWVLGPSGNTLAREWVEDDGVVAGNERYRDGIYEVLQDYRYREWHRHHSPGGTPPGKERSPFLDHPERLPKQSIRVEVPDDGQGLYRVVCIGTWDHWFSLTPDRPLIAGVHPGPGPLYLPPGRFEQAWLYVPPIVEDIGVSISEEIEPFNWKAEVLDEDGNTLLETTPQTFFNAAWFEAEEGDTVLEVRLTGNTAGAGLHLTGVPLVLAPTPEAALQLRGGLEIDDQGRQTFHPWQRVINEWVDQLDPAELELDLSPLDQVEDQELRERLAALPELLEAQDLDPESETYGAFPSADEALALLTITALDDENNPFFGHPTLIKRLLLERKGTFFDRLQPDFSRLYRSDLPGRVAYQEGGRLTQLPFRTTWYSFMPGPVRVFDQTLPPLKDAVDQALPPEVAAAWKRSLDAMALGRRNMHVGEISNQWTYNMVHFMNIAEFTGNEEIPQMIREQAGMLLTPGYMGRIDPDPTPYESAVGFGRPADLGLVGAGYMADGQGFDSAYTREQVSNIGHRGVWKLLDGLPFDEWWRNYYHLKAHLTLPREGGSIENAFNDLTSPTDFNSRTQVQLIFSGLPAEWREQIPYGDWWGADPSEVQKPLPALEEEPFFRSIDDQFFFINTPSYYAIVYGGPIRPLYTTWVETEVEDGSAQLVGHIGMGYGGKQLSSPKLGGISAIFVRGGGPTLLSHNHDVFYSNNLWGRTKQELFPTSDNTVDPHIIAEGYTASLVRYNEEGRVFEKSGEFEYAPLLFRRLLHFKDDEVQTEVTVTAANDIELAEFYEAIPFMVEGRNIILVDGDGEDRKVDQEELAGLAGETLTLSGWRVENEEGLGSTFLLDEPREVLVSEPMRYRTAAAMTQSFSLVLPTEMQAAEEVSIRYTIRSE